MLVVAVLVVGLLALAALGLRSTKRRGHLNAHLTEDLKRRKIENRSAAERNSWHGR